MSQQREEEEKKMKKAQKKRKNRSDKKSSPKKTTGCEKEMGLSINTTRDQENSIRNVTSFMNEIQYAACVNSKTPHILIMGDEYSRNSAVPLNERLDGKNKYNIIPSIWVRTTL